MLLVAKININDYEAVRTAFIQNFRVQTNNWVVITNFTNMKQRKDKTVQQVFTRIGDIGYNYNLQKPKDEIMGALWAAPEEHADLGLQFFIAGLHTNISFEVIKSKTMDLYEAFMIAHTYETAVKRKEEMDSMYLLNSKINKIVTEFEDEEHAEIEANRQKFQQKKTFCSNNGLAYQQRSNGGNGWH
jgi:hypothetical protein